MNIARTIAIFATGLFILATTLQAKRTCRIIFPERPQDAPKIAYIFDGKVSQSVTLPSMNLSEVITLPSGELAIAMTSNKITDPKELPPNTPFLMIPEKLMEFYIIITSDPNSKELPIKMNLVDTGEGKLKAGETLWYNLTDHRIAAKLGDTEMTIDPRGRTISKDPVTASGYYTARFVYQAQGKGAYSPITEQCWWHDLNCKYLGFMHNTGGKLPKIYLYRDYRDPEEETTTKEAKSEVAE